MQVTYLLGAGASCNCLPTYSNFKSRFYKFVSFIEFYATQHTYDDKYINEQLKEILIFLKDLNDELDFHSTPDTVAKKYFHTGRTGKLENLKLSLILYFIYEQSGCEKEYENFDDKPVKDIIDKRYDSFIAGLLKPIPGKLELLNNFNILTWNYDLQFEIAYSTYSNAKIPNSQHLIQSYPRIYMDSQNIQTDRFSIVHLNGIAYGSAGNDQDRLGSFGKGSEQYAEYICAVYKSMLTSGRMSRYGGTQLLNFAWENLDTSSTPIDSGVKYAMEVSLNTEILVINGYSFPIFNRAIDKSILQRMANLEQIYIQSPQAETIKNIMLKEMDISTTKIEDVGYWNSFYIPNWDRPSESDLTTSLLKSFR